MNESLLHLVLEYNDLWARNQWPNTLFSLLCLVIGLLGNGYVLFIYKFKLKTKAEARYFIPYLAIADACASFFSCVAFIIGNFHILYFPWDFLCKGALFAMWMPALTSTFLLLAIAVQRYTRTKLTGKHFSLTWRRAAVAIIVTVSVIYSTPFLFIAGVGETTREYKDVNLTSVKCRTQNGQYPTFEKVYVAYLIAALALNLFITFGLYISIAVVVYRHQGKRNGSESTNTTPATSGTDETTLQDTEMENMGSLNSRAKAADVHASNPMTSCCKAIRKRNKSSSASPSTNFNIMFLTIVVVYALSFAPTGITTVLVNTAELDSRKDIPLWKVQLYSILVRTFVINNIANPFIYGYFDLEFRKYLKNLLYCFCCRKI